ncbi:MAG: UDP-N-acetylmuramoyl-L-alanine--D-glutamate ligase [Phycisphaeraceae bacterium]
MQSLQHKRVVVMGLGRFGGGVGVTRFLVSRGAEVLVTDMAPPDKLRQSMAQLQDLPVRYRLGEHRENDFVAADLIVVNPAVDQRGNVYLAAARQAGVPTTSEIRLLVQHLPNRLRTIGITGSAGKSTTTAMIGHALRKLLVSPSTNGAGERVHVGGNIGGSLLERIDDIRPDDWVVLELSSFMLQDMHDDHWSPHIAVITNLSPNHLDRHGTLDAYRAAKQVILDHQRQADGDVAIGGPGVHDVFLNRVSDFRTFDRPVDWRVEPPIKLLIPGDHNQLNARLASTAVQAAITAPQWQSWDALADFAGLPHRLQFVAQHADVRFFNDSKATTPEAAMLAIGSFAAGIVHVILGGSDKGSDFTELAKLARQHCRAIYSIGATGDRIAAACDAAPGPAAVQRCGTIDIAMQSIVQHYHQGDVVLLSPACASYDQFENYEKRGASFIEHVLRYTGEGAPLPRGAGGEALRAG